jgi:alcohol dehydrogenase class IV
MILFSGAGARQRRHGVESRQYRFFTPTRCIFGEGCSRQAGQRARELNGTKALLVTDKGLITAGLCGGVLESLQAAGIETLVFDRVRENPTEENVQEGSALIASQRIDMVLALGGGSPMDAAKAMAALSVHEGNILEYEYGLKSFTQQGPPVIAIPTTAGTGSEVTMGSVITDQRSHRKIDVVSQLMAPRVSLVDPELTYSLPPAMTAATGMDALTHSIEGYTATLASPLTDAIHLRVIELLGRYLMRAYEQGGDVEARHHVMLASMMAGIGFPNSGLGAVHGLTLPLGGHFGIPHGTANAVMLPFVMRFNSSACSSKLADVAGALGGKGRDSDSAIEKVFALRKALGIPTLSSFKVPADRLRTLARDALGRNSNCVTNPRVMSEEDAVGVYAAALEEA